MRTKKRVITSPPAAAGAARHPFPRGRHQSYWNRLPLVLLFVGLAGGLLTSDLQAGGDGKDKKKARPPESVITGTVFTEKGFSLPGAEVKIYRAGERKARWEAVSDRRGEFGVRVPLGAEYEVKVKAKGYLEQAQKVDARSSSYENMVFRMAPVTGDKKQ